MDFETKSKRVSFPGEVAKILKKIVLDAAPI